MKYNNIRTKLYLLILYPVIILKYKGVAAFPRSSAGDAESCRSWEFLCKRSKICAPTHWRCDGFPDCDDGSDEINCPGGLAVTVSFPLSSTAAAKTTSKTTTTTTTTTKPSDKPIVFIFETKLESTTKRSKGCEKYHWQCKSGKCIPMDWKCDGEKDCPDLDDESHCKGKDLCKDHEFRCGDGGCIPKLWHCDSEPDCLDMSDEMVDCIEGPPPPRKVPTTKRVPISLTTPLPNHSTSEPCEDDSFSCKDGSCISNMYVCDFVDDCADGRDESVCEGDCGDYAFRCKAGRSCITHSWRCDGEEDCEDGSDEEDC